MSTQRRLVDEGSVFCPVLGRDVEIDRCLGCPRLVDADLESRRPYVKCDVPAPLEPEARFSVSS